MHGPQPVAEGIGGAGGRDLRGARLPNLNATPALSGAKLHCAPCSTNWDWLVLAPTWSGLHRVRAFLVPFTSHALLPTQCCSCTLHGLPSSSPTGALAPALASPEGGFYLESGVA